ncbi:MAG: hypothetical protein VKL59_13635 [Nostocaceae cyanobacterium]|nr:hypothetical protein [Nostocaceae cyanobacterium]
MTLNFVASGHLGIVDGETKQPVCLFRTTQTSTGRQNHMSSVSPDSTKIITVALYLRNKSMFPYRKMLCE